MSIIINTKRIEIPGVTTTNYLDDDEPTFKRYNRPPLEPWRIDHLVLHETGGASEENCKKTLLKKGLGVHLICASDGSISCHNDLVQDLVYHAGYMNGRSIGIEFINPYTPLFIPPNMRTIYNRIIPAQWWTWIPSMQDVNIRALVEHHHLKEVPRAYVLPTESQLNSLIALVQTITPDIVPLEFPTIDLNRRQPRIKRWNSKEKPSRGIVAHRDFAGHSDGRFLLEYLVSKIQNEKEHN